MTDLQLIAITRHGRRLLTIFRDATERDPVKLCKKLRRLETVAHRIGERLCNEEGYTTEQAYEDATAVLNRVRGLSGDWPPVILNRDPRGYALKIESETMRERGYVLETDLGGNGIIAPEIGPNG